MIVKWLEEHRLYYMFTLRNLSFALGVLFILGYGSFREYAKSGSVSDQSVKKCNMDIDCGVAKKCISGVCTGGIAPSIRGSCVTGDFGKRVCSNSGKSCNVDSQCLGP